MSIQAVIKNVVGAVAGDHGEPDPLLAAGTVLAVGQCRVIPERFLSEGGFARVYVGRDVCHNRPVALKRILTASEEQMDLARREVKLMHRLRHKNIVQFYEAQLFSIGHGRSEIFISMEFCPGGHVVGLMNRRMQERFHEGEVLQIFGDVCEAVAFLHYQQPPVIHRDLKVENVLIAADNTFKLCDFGSCTTHTVPPGTAIKSPELERLQDDIERNTTLQYRAPELCDLLRRRGISPKVDVWALGVLLYKLCYFTTPFENEGQFAILNGRYEVPEKPRYSTALVALIRGMLADAPGRRPNIYKAVRVVCDMRRVSCPIADIYGAEEDAQVGGGDVAAAAANGGTPQASITAAAMLATHMHAYMPEQALQQVVDQTAAGTSPPTGVRRGRTQRVGGSSMVGPVPVGVSLDKVADMFSQQASVPVAQANVADMSSQPASMPVAQVRAVNGVNATPTAATFFDIFDQAPHDGKAMDVPATSTVDPFFSEGQSHLPANDMFAGIAVASSGAVPDPFFEATAVVSAASDSFFGNAPVSTAAPLVDLFAPVPAKATTPPTMYSVAATPPQSTFSNVQPRPLSNSNINADLMDLFNKPLPATSAQHGFAASASSPRTISSSTSGQSPAQMQPNYAPYIPSSLTAGGAGYMAGPPKPPTFPRSRTQDQFGNLVNMNDQGNRTRQ